MFLLYTIVPKLLLCHYHHTLIETIPHTPRGSRPRGLAAAARFVAGPRPRPGAAPCARAVAAVEASAGAVARRRQRRWRKNGTHDFRKRGSRGLTCRVLGLQRAVGYGPLARPPQSRGARRRQPSPCLRKSISEWTRRDNLCTGPCAPVFSRQDWPRGASRGGRVSADLRRAGVRSMPRAPLAPEGRT